MTLYDLTPDWKREHRIALIGAIALGAFIGLVRAISQIDSWSTWHNGLYEFESFYFFDYRAVVIERLFLWPLFGGIIGGSTVYISHLLRQ